jgi:DNA-binding MarR family transcriptional regulator
MRFVNEAGVQLRELETLARTKTNLNGMIRWGYITLDPVPVAGKRSPPRKSRIIRATPKGLVAREVWYPLAEEVEARWRERIGRDALLEWKGSLAAIISDLDPDLPDSLPILGYGLKSPPPIRAPRPPAEDPEDLPLVVMLARVLRSFTVEYESTAGLSLAIGANVLRLVNEPGARIHDLQRVSGVSKEALAMAVGFLEKKGMATVASDGRARTLNLTPAGRRARAAYNRIVWETEATWRSRFGNSRVQRLRRALEQAVSGKTGEGLLAEAVIAPPGGWRAAIKKPDTLPWQPMVLHRGGYPDGS